MAVLDSSLRKGPSKELTFAQGLEEVIRPQEHLGTEYFPEQRSNRAKSLRQPAGGSKELEARGPCA